MTIKVSRVFNGFFLAAFEAGGNRPQPQGLRASASRYYIKARRLGIKPGGVANGASNEASGFSWFLSKAICLSLAKIVPRAPHFQQKHPKTTSVFFSLKVVPESAESRSFLLDCHRPAPVVRPPRAQDAFAPRA